ncbi:MAG TPA: hypothetical protein VH796_04040 [Nitrososphaeraceae archaeon]
MKRTLSSASAKTVFTSEISTEIFHRLKLSIILGELLTGSLVGPFAL